MVENTLWKEEKFQCPYCDAVSIFTCIYSVMGSHNGWIYPYSVWACHYCDRAIFIRHVRTQSKYTAVNERRLEITFPAKEPIVDERIPVGIAEDFIEAMKCLNVKAYKAAVVMARRTIQKMCLNLGASKKKKLHKQIEQLTKSGKLHPDLAGMATEIRFFGNDGAHPESDDLDEVSEQDAGEIVEFALELLDDLYVRPEKVKALKKRRQSTIGQEAKTPTQA